MDASISEVDEITGHMPAYGKLAAVAVVSNEDGAQHVCAEVFQALAGVRFTVPRITVHLASLLKASPYLAIKGEEEG